MNNTYTDEVPATDTETVSTSQTTAEQKPVSKNQQLNSVNYLSRKCVIKFGADSLENLIYNHILLMNFNTQDDGYDSLKLGVKLEKYECAIPMNFLTSNYFIRLMKAGYKRIQKALDNLVDSKFISVRQAESDKTVKWHIHTTVTVAKILNLNVGYVKSNEKIKDMVKHNQRQSDELEDIKDYALSQCGSYDLKQIIFEFAELKKEYNSVKDEFAELKNNFDSVKDECNSAKEECNSAKEECNSVKEELASTKHKLYSEVSDIRKELNNTKKKIGNLQSDVNNNKKNLDAIKSNIDYLREQFDEFNKDR